MCVYVCGARMGVLCVLCVYVCSVVYIFYYHSALRTTKFCLCPSGLEVKRTDKCYIGVHV